MIVLSAKELESHGILYRTASTIEFRNRLFVKGQTLSKRSSQVVANLYRDYQKAGIRCFIVDAMGCLTLWREVNQAQRHGRMARKAQAPARQSSVPFSTNANPAAHALFADAPISGAFKAFNDGDTKL